MRGIREISEYYKHHKRDLPWRKTRDAYKILVSEMMLQQTQVGRVIPFYARFTKRFPNAHALAKAPLREVLRHWQGLGYNRRAKFLHEAAKVISRDGFPKTTEEIENLPGVGQYTAGAIAVFAYNSKEVFIETNIRTVFTHFYFPKKEKVSDADIFPLVEKALTQSNMQPRDFYAALMDYGSHLKRRGIRLNAKSKHYVKQKKFEGSARQLRGALLRELLKGPATAEALAKKFSRTKKETAQSLARLVSEGLVRKRSGRFSI